MHSSSTQLLTTWRIYLLLSWWNILFLEGAYITTKPESRKSLLTTKLSSSTFQCVDRRKVLKETLSSFIVIGTTTSEATNAKAIVPPQRIIRKEEEFPPLISLESAVTKIRNNDENIFAKRLNYPNPGLREIATPVTAWGSDLELFVERLLENMETNATTPIQFGIDNRIIILRGDASPLPEGRPFILVNPNILYRSSDDKMVLWRENSLAVPQDIVWGEGEAPSASDPTFVVAKGSRQQMLEVDLFRDAFVEIAAQDLTGKPIRKVLEGEPARSFQQELDHLNGILLVDYASLEELPPVMVYLEGPFHAARQKKAFARAIYQGNSPLYY